MGFFDKLLGSNSQLTARKVQEGLKPLPNVQNIIAVGSGKGGVGKSTTSVNLALALQAQGLRVGILDADVFGPSIPKMLGVSGKPETKDGKSMEPVKAMGLQLMSVGFLIEEDSPMIWRGPIVTQTLMQLLTETNWINLDVLIVDLPPGTGDTQLTMAQKIPVVGAVVVTTPQDVALLDARKGLKMFEKVNIPILGLVENMSTHICSNCGHEEAIFGEGGAQKMSDDYGVPILGQLPLEIKIRIQADEGQPILKADPKHPVSHKYLSIAQNLLDNLEKLPKDYSSKFPDIQVKEL